jgi:sulfite reductase (NADPH) flavoprotein alpha-component
MESGGMDRQALTSVAAALSKPAEGRVAAPVLPDNAPFTPEERAWINGYLAGLWVAKEIREGNGAGASPSDAPGKEPAGEKQTVCVLYASQTGNAESVARRLVQRLQEQGLPAQLQCMGSYPRENLSQERWLLAVTSTYGDGDFPDNGVDFWEFLSSQRAPRIQGLRFAVLALGDSGYPNFCQAGRKLDQRLEELGGQRVHPRVECDVDFEKKASQWIEDMLQVLRREVGGSLASEPAGTRDRSSGSSSSKEAQTTESAYSRERPFLAKLEKSFRLTGEGVGKETRHIEISLEGSDLSYLPGDALGVLPRNCPELVEEILREKGWSGEYWVELSSGKATSLREALSCHLEIHRLPPETWRACKDPQELVQACKPLLPRLYSIASSPRVYPRSVHLTVAVVRYRDGDRLRKGVASTFLAERLGQGDRLPVYVHQNPNFRPPPPDQALIMVGPGTGIAPFRAFLQEREMEEAPGPSWLFFGEWHREGTFYYREELQRWAKMGVLGRLDVAFSRDGSEKVYVWHRMKEEAKELFRWLQDGAYFYVCGSLAMGADVEKALLQILQKEGSWTEDRAAEYLAELRREGRYRRDVY